MEDILTPSLLALMSYTQPGNAKGPAGGAAAVLGSADDANVTRLQGIAARTQQSMRQEAWVTTRPEATSATHCNVLQNLDGLL